MMESIAERLVWLRSGTGASLQDVASAVDSSKGHLWELENGTSDNPTLKTLRGLADYYKVTVSYIIGDEGLRFRE